MKRARTAAELRLIGMSAHQPLIDRVRGNRYPVNYSPRTGEPECWYRIVNKVGNSDQTSIYIYDEIGAWGVTAQDFVRDLVGLDTSRIELHLNTPGGEVFDGIAMYNALRSHRAEIVSIVDGIAASAGSFIMQAGDERVMMPNATAMIHEASGLCIGNAADMRELADLLDMMSDNIASIYAERGGGEPADWRATMQGTRWYTATDAVEAGLADRVETHASADDEDKPKNRTAAPAAPAFNRADVFRSALRGAFSR